MGKRSNSRTERDLDPLRDCLPEAALGDIGNAVSPVSLHVAFTIKLVVVESRHKIDSLLYHQLDIAIFKIDSVFKRLDAGVQAVAETLSAKGVAGDFASLLVGLIHNRVHFLRRESRRDYHFAVARK